jgi:hypothetical protein
MTISKSKFGSGCSIVLSTSFNEARSRQIRARFCLVQNSIKGFNSSFFGQSHVIKGENFYGTYWLRVQCIWVRLMGWETPW